MSRFSRSLILALPLTLLAACARDPAVSTPTPSVGVMGGVPRGEMAQILLLAKYGEAYLPPEPGGAPAFSDIQGHTYQAWIEALAAEGIVIGDPQGRYWPDDLVTRAETAVMMLKLRHGPSYWPPDPEGGSFVDVGGHWAERWIEALKDEGLIPSPIDDAFRPDAALDFGDLVLFLVLATG